MAVRHYADDTAELWAADATDAEAAARVLGGRRAAALVVDAPYSDRTHAGHGAGTAAATRAYAARVASGVGAPHRDLAYPSWSSVEVEACCAAWLPHAAGWCVSLTDHILAPVWDAAFRARDLYVFAPLPLVETGSRVRLTGDGPSCWTCWLVVARPRSREFASWGTLPGAYVQPAERRFSDRIVGGKPIRATRAIVADYSRPGDLVVDPCCGAGTTLLAARLEGRRAIGCDTSHAHLQIAARRLRPYPPGSLFGEAT